MKRRVVFAANGEKTSIQLGTMGLDSGDKVWYYLKANGYMATGTQTINGKIYRFDSSGRWMI